MSSNSLNTLEIENKKLQNKNVKQYHYHQQFDKS